MKPKKISSSEEPTQLIVDIDDINNNNNKSSSSTRVGPHGDTDSTTVSTAVKTTPPSQSPPPQNNNSNSDSDSRLALLFHQLDVNNDGRIDVHDLSHILTKKHGIKSNSTKDELVQEFFAKSDLDSSGDITLEEFLDYAKKHEKKLKLIFTNIDKNNDGKIDVNEVCKVLREELGVAKVDVRGVREVLSRMQSRKTLTTSNNNTNDYDPSSFSSDSSPQQQQHPLEISWEDWRDYLILTPQLDNLQDVLLKHWRHNTYLDVGEDTSIPDDFTKDELQSGMWWRHLVAGGFAGMVSRTATAPLDRLKVFLQVHGSKLTGGLIPTLRSMLAEGGVTSLWRGNGINVLKIAPESAFKFLTYEQGKRFLKGRDPDREIRIEERFLAGSVAGAISQSLIYPLEVVKTRLALRRTGQYASVLSLTTQMYQREGGLRAFYRGYIPNLLGILPYAGIDLAIYETLKKSYINKYNNDCDNNNPNVFVLLTCGTVSSACGQIASYPLALVRTRLQAASSSVNNYSMTALFKNIIQSEGVVGLYRGLTPNFLKVAPAVSISYVVYERVRVKLGVEMS